MATCVVSGTFLDPSETAIASATVKFVIDNPFIGNTAAIISPKQVSTTTAVDGTWSLTLTQSSSGTLILECPPDGTSSSRSYSFGVIVPAAASATFTSVWADPTNFTSPSNFPLTFSMLSGQLATNQLPVLGSTDIWVGNGSNAATAVAISGDASLATTGALTVNMVGSSTAANIHSAELLANAATSSNTASTTVKRDASGNFSAGTITASLSGTATNFSGSLSGDVTGTQSATVVASVGASSAANVHSAELAANAATATPTAGKIVKYDASGNLAGTNLSGTNTGDVTLAAVGSSPNANGISLSGQVLNLQPASATQPGVLSNTTQSIQGNKTFINSVNVTGTLTSGQIIDSGLTASTVPYADASKQLTSSAVTPTELGYVSGVTSSIQTQLNNLSSGLVFKPSCDYATTAALPTVIYANGSSGVGATISGFAFGALSVDSSSPSVGQRVLVKNQASHLQNGAYSVTATGGISAVFVLTRTTDFNQSAEMDEGSSFLVLSGTVNSDTIWSMTSTVPINVGTDSIDFVQIAGPGSVTAGTGISVTGNQVSLAAMSANTVKANITGGSAVPTDVPFVSTNTVSSGVFRDSSGNFSAATITATLSGNASTATSATTATNATNVATTATNATNASFFPTFVSSSSSGNQGVDTATGLTFNPSTNTLTTTTFSGALSGNATTATSATNATNTAITDDTTTNATMYPTWVTTTTGNLPQKVSSTKLTFNPSSGLLTTTTFAGALTGTASGNTTYTANNHGVVISGSGNTMTVIAPDASTTKVLTSGGANADPTWQVPSSGTGPRAEIYVNTPNGHGSTNTKILRFSNSRKATGDLVFNQSSTNGDNITTGSDGIYAISAGFTNSGGGDNIGITINDSALTTNLSTPLTYAQGLRVMANSSGAGNTISISWTGMLSSGDVIRAHDNGSGSIQADSTGFLSVCKVNT